MIYFLLLLVLVLIGLTAAAVLGKIGGFLADPTTSQSFGGLPDGPDGPLSAAGIAELHFDQALRGYRMDQVDDVIDALGARIRELESQAAPQPVTTPSEVEAPTQSHPDRLSDLPREPRED